MQFFNSGRLLHEVPLPEPATSLCTGMFTSSARQSGTTQVGVPVHIHPHDPHPLKHPPQMDDDGAVMELEHTAIRQSQ